MIFLRTPTALRLRRTLLPTVRYAFARDGTGERNVFGLFHWPPPKYIVISVIKLGFDFDDVSTVLIVRKEKSSLKVRFWFWGQVGTDDRLNLRTNSGFGRQTCFETQPIRRVLRN